MDLGLFREAGMPRHLKSEDSPGCRQADMKKENKMDVAWVGLTDTISFLHFGIPSVQDSMASIIAFAK